MKKVFVPFTAVVLACSGPALTGKTVTAPLLFLCVVQPPRNDVINHACMIIPRALHVVPSGPMIPMSGMVAVLVASREGRAGTPSSAPMHYIGQYLCSRRERAECLPVKKFAVDGEFYKSKTLTEVMGIDDAYAMLSAARSEISQEQSK